MNGIPLFFLAIAPSSIPDPCWLSYLASEDAWGYYLQLSKTFGEGQDFVILSLFPWNPHAVDVPCPPQIPVLESYPHNGVVLRGGAFGVWFLGHQGGALVHGISALLRREAREMPFLFASWGLIRQPPATTGQGPSPWSWWCGRPDLRRAAPKTGRNTPLSFQPPRLRCPVAALRWLIRLTWPYPRYSSL